MMLSEIARGLYDIYRESELYQVGISWYWQRAPAKAEYPYIVARVITSRRDNLLDVRGRIYVIQLTCYDAPSSSATTATNHLDMMEDAYNNRWYETANYRCWVTLPHTLSIVHETDLGWQADLEIEVYAEVI